MSITRIIASIIATDFDNNHINLIEFIALDLYRHTDQFHLFFGVFIWSYFPFDRIVVDGDNHVWLLCSCCILFTLKTVFKLNSAQHTHSKKKKNVYTITISIFFLFLCNPKRFLAVQKKNKHKPSTTSHIPNQHTKNSIYRLFFFRQSVFRVETCNVDKKKINSTHQ